MDKYTDTYKKYFMDKLGLPVEQFDDVITPAKRPSAEHISKMNRMAEKYKAAEEASKERMARGVEKNLVSPTAEKYKAVLTEGEKKMAGSILSGNIGKAAAEAFPGEAKMIMGLDAGLQAIRDQAGKYDYDTFAKPAPMETPYGKSLLSYTPEGKIAGKTGAALRGLGKLAEKALPYLPYASGVGAAFTALDLGQALSEVQDKGAAKIAEDYKNSQLAESEDTGDKLMMKMEPMERGLEKPQEYMDELTQKYMDELKKKKQYTPEERMKLKEMLSKYRANAALRPAE
jgi:hypothetical protein